MQSLAFSHGGWKHTTGNQYKGGNHVTVGGYRMDYSDTDAVADRVVCLCVAGRSCEADCETPENDCN